MVQPLFECGTYCMILMKCSITCFVLCDLVRNVTNFLKVGNTYHKIISSPVLRIYQCLKYCWHWMFQGSVFHMARWTSYWRQIMWSQFISLVASLLSLKADSLRWFLTTSVSNLCMYKLFTVAYSKLAPSLWWAGNEARSYSGQHFSVCNYSLIHLHLKCHLLWDNALCPCRCT